MNNYYSTLENALKRGKVERSTNLTNGNVILKQNDKILFGEVEDGEYLSENISSEINIVIFGSGHVGKALCDISHILGLETTVIDERSEFLTRKRFPYSKRLLFPYDEVLKKELNIFSPYYVIVTHGHKRDKDCLMYALTHPHTYIGMIGSLNKVKKTKESLLSSGYSKELLDSIHSPIGLDIGAETPEEIALSILFEIVKCYRSDKESITLRKDYLQKIKNKSGVSIRIISSSGSSPRHEGSEMFLFPDGENVGTIGGGNLELEATNEAKKLLSSNEDFKILSYCLQEGEKLEMICGGNDMVILKKFS